MNKKLKHSVCLTAIVFASSSIAQSLDGFCEFQNSSLICQNSHSSIRVDRPASGIPGVYSFELHNEDPLRHSTVSCEPIFVNGPNVEKASFGAGFSENMQVLNIFTKQECRLANDEADTFIYTVFLDEKVAEVEGVNPTFAISKSFGERLPLIEVSATNTSALSSFVEGDIRKHWLIDRWGQLTGPHHFQNPFKTISLYWADGNFCSDDRVLANFEAFPQIMIEGDFFSSSMGVLAKLPSRGLEKRSSVFLSSEWVQTASQPSCLQRAGGALIISTK